MYPKPYSIYLRGAIWFRLQGLGLVSYHHPHHPPTLPPQAPPPFRPAGDKDLEGFGFQGFGVYGIKVQEFRVRGLSFRRIGFLLQGLFGGPCSYKPIILTYIFAT